MAPVTRDELIKQASRAIHMEEWCPARAKCSGTSASSDAHARAALKAIEGELRAEGLEAGRALVALHSAVARKEGRVEGLCMALEAIRPRNPGQYLETHEAIIEALVAKAKATGE